MKPKHGGKREGAGRPATGRKIKTGSINLTPEHWAKLDKVRGEKTRSAWIAERIKRARIS